MQYSLGNGCYYTQPWVSPKNWRSLNTRKGLNQNWYVQCKYFDPLFKEKYPYGFPFRKKINKFQSFEERKDIIEIMLKEIPLLFVEKGYNPITKQSKVKEKPLQGSLHPDLPILEAFDLVKDKLKISDKHKKQIIFMLNRFGKAVRELRMDDISIKDFKRSELKTILEYLVLPDVYYNKFRSYLSTLFNELVEYDCCEVNLTRDIRKRKELKKMRETFDLSELKQILEYLKTNHYEFYLYTQIFFYSGARSSELLRVKKSDVDIEKQEYKIIIQKGRQYTETIKVILPSALPYWKELLNKATKNDYLFSKGLVPGPITIEPYQITKRFYRLVKQKLCFVDGELSEIKKNKNEVPITADFYSLKHLFLDELDKATQRTEINLSSKLASHTTATITNSVYLVGKKKRENEILKGLDIRI